MDQSLEATALKHYMDLNPTDRNRQLLCYLQNGFVLYANWLIESSGATEEWEPYFYFGIARSFNGLLGLDLEIIHWFCKRRYYEPFGGKKMDWTSSAIEQFGIHHFDLIERCSKKKPVLSKRGFCRRLHQLIPDDATIQLLLEVSSQTWRNTSASTSAFASVPAPIQISAKERIIGLPMKIVCPIHLGIQMLKENKLIQVVATAAEKDVQHPEFIWTTDS
jgi:hypothetical protein